MLIVERSVAQAKTGTGKTLAFLLPLLQRMIQEDPSLASRSAAYDARSDDVRGIILSPTRELAEQIAVEAKRLTKNTGLVVQCAVGGTSKSSMLRQTQREGCHLLVATPGRLNDLLQDTRSGIEAPNLAALVLDEADRMLDTGFERELNEIVDALPKADEKVRQTMLVSATIPDNVIRLARTMVRADDFEFVQTIPENETLTHDKVPQHIVPVSSWANVFPAMWELIDRSIEEGSRPGAQPFKAIVYLNTTNLVELAGELAYQRRAAGISKISTYTIQSQISQMARTKAADLFRKARSGILFSSDVTARGMDFPDVTHVIQIDPPRERESYIHRLGRTGRQDKYGEGWIIVPPTSVATTRKLLRGLPLQRNDSLTSANYDFTSGEPTLWHKQIQDASQNVSKSLITRAYTSIFGAATGDKDELVDDLNALVTKAFGWEEPPPVSANWAMKMGLGRSGVNISERTFDDDRRGGRDRPSFGGGNRFGGGDRFGGGGGGNRFSRGGNDFNRSRGDRGSDRRSSDPFQAMGQDARRDDYGKREYSGNRSRSRY